MFDPKDPHLSMSANNTLLGGGVRVRIWIKEQKIIKGTTKLLMAVLDVKEAAKILKCLVGELAACILLLDILTTVLEIKLACPSEG